MLVNVSEGMDLDTAVKKYEQIVAPANYKPCFIEYLSPFLTVVNGSNHVIQVASYSSDDFQLMVADGNPDVVFGKYGVFMSCRNISLQQPESFPQFFSYFRSFHKLFSRQ